jgi:NAD(P)H-dependent FMN reductase
MNNKREKNHMSIKVAVLSGSLRAESFNTKLAKAFVGAAPEGLKRR